MHDAKWCPLVPTGAHGCPVLKREYECANVGAEGDRTHSERAGDHHKVIGSGPISATVLNGPKEIEYELR